MARTHDSSIEQYGIELLHVTGNDSKNCFAEKLMLVGLSIEDDTFLPKSGSRLSDSLELATDEVNMSGLCTHSDLIIWGSGT